MINSKEDKKEEEKKYKSKHHNNIISQILKSGNSHWSVENDFGSGGRVEAGSAIQNYDCGQGNNEKWSVLGYILQVKL